MRIVIDIDNDLAAREIVQFAMGCALAGWSITVDNDQGENLPTAVGHETGPIHPVVHSVMMSDFEAERAWERHSLRQARLAAMYEDFDHIMEFSCPHCGVGADEVCVTKGGKVLYRPRVHSLRRKAWYDAGAPDAETTWEARVAAKHAARNPKAASWMDARVVPLDEV